MTAAELLAISQTAAANNATTVTLRSGTVRTVEVRVNSVGDMVQITVEVLARFRSRDAAALARRVVAEIEAACGDERPTRARVRGQQVWMVGDNVRAALSLA